MSAHHRKPLNSSRVRARKRTLAARDGAWCTYCWRLFADLRQATIDHVVPISLYRTWRAEDTVLACKPCNDRKADRLPLLFTVLLTAVPDAVPGVLGVPGGVPVAVPAVPESADRERAASGVHAPTGRAFTVADAVLLARMAAAYESGTWPLQSADSTPDQKRDQSRPDLRDEVRHTRVARVLPDAVNTAVRTTVNACPPDPTTDRPTRPNALREAA